MHYFLIAGETSGDLHGSHLIEALRRRDPSAVVTFVGGDRMAAAAGHDPLTHCRSMAFMGFSEVLRNLGTIGRILRSTRRSLRQAAPDALILIDYPSFNLKMARTAHALGTPVYYYISPKIWAWKKWRIRDIRRYVYRVLSILPFEPAFYRANGFDATYVGNPSREEIDADLSHLDSRADFLARHGLRDRPLIALMPGSRRGEIRNNLPVMRAAVDTFPQYRAVIVGAPDIDSSLYEQYGGHGLPVIRHTPAALILPHCRAALVTSGTATLEAALCATPQVVCYRANGSRLSYNIMKRLLSVDYVSLPNLILGREAVPEMLLHLCTREAVADRLAPLLREGTPERTAQLQSYDEMRRRLGTQNAASTAAEAIYNSLINKD